MVELNQNVTKAVVTIYGKKGEGKTTLALNPKYFSGKIAALTFDNKTDIIAKEIYKSQLRLKVFDCINLLVEDHENYTTTAELQIKQIQSTIKMMEGKEVDWVIVDGLEIYSQIAEMAMRKMHNLKPSQGIANLNVWKDRKIMIKSLHRAAFKIAKKGVIYTTYTEKDEIIDEGETVNKKDSPKWIDVIMWETDIVLHAYVNTIDKNHYKYFVDVASSKIPSLFKTGETIEITLNI